MTTSTPGDPDIAAPGAGSSGLRERKKRRTREEIATAAFELVAEFGAEATTVEMIAERAGISPRTFFNYFDGKDDAVIAVVADRFAGVARILEELPASGSAILDVHDALVAFIDRESASAAGEPGGFAARDQQMRVVFEKNPHLIVAVNSAVARTSEAAVSVLAARHPDDPDPPKAAAAALALGFSLLRLVFQDLAEGDADAHLGDRFRAYYDALARHRLP
ncbi:DNA-binding transcriptional regulator, AcrR family [Rhodococcus triatomae]|uniref:DNA-binding transcriptional regulator, AcrR family n=1 Tax=Rhodococcus triatomae TaxID=300028 RepID=A0A1G8F5T9_9NOCA|nr:TetR/AcrR family transcriptional regulator [Rhodococcus triatomae]SDH77369.1 DNA-binding transcriptional regulator, AcrR family [Rhodococcus triatomae]